MREIFQKYQTQSSINLSLPHKYPNYLKNNNISSEYIINLNKNQELIMDKKLHDIFQGEKIKNNIKLKHKKFFEEYKFGILRYHDFTPRLNNINFFLDEKIDINNSLNQTGKLNFKHKRVVSSDVISRFTFCNKDKYLENSHQKNLLYENYDFHNKNIGKNLDYLKKTNILYFSQHTYNSECNKNKEIIKEESDFDSYEFNNKKIKEKNLFNIIDNRNVNHKNKKSSMKNQENISEKIEIQNNNESAIKGDNYNFNFMKFKDTNKNIHEINHNNIDIDNSKKAQSSLYTSSAKRNNIMEKNRKKKNDLFFKIKNQKGLKINLYNTSNNKFDEKLTNKIFSTKNLKGFNIENSSFKNISNKKSINEINEYEDILEAKNFKKTFNSMKASSQNHFRNNIEDTLTFYNKEFETFNSKENISNLIRNKDSVKSSIPKKVYGIRCNKYFNKNNFDKENKIDKIKNKNANITIDNYKKLNDGDYMKFEKEFLNSRINFKIIEDNHIAKRNFNSNFDSKKYSSALLINNIIQLPTILHDPKIFEEILNRNTNQILEKGNK